MSPVVDQHQGRVTGLGGSHASLAGRRVLIFSLTYPPEEVGTAPYAGGFAEHLADVGASVQVVTGMPHYPQWRVWDQYRSRWRMHEQRNGVHVLRLRNYVPAEQTALKRACYDASFLVRAIGETGGPGPDAVIGIVPSLADGVLAWAAARRHHAPLGIIVQDLVGAAAEQSGIPGGRAVARSAMAIERRLLVGASRVGAVSGAFFPYLHGIGVAPDRVRQVRNWSRMPAPQRSPDEVRQSLGWEQRDTVVLHAGNMGFKQALEHVIDAARLAVSTYPRLQFVFMGDGSQRARLEADARRLPNVSFLAPLYDQDLADVLGAADILLVNERSSVRDMSLPSKLTSYFVAGRPVLASVMSTGATAREIQRSGGGIIVNPDDPRRLLETATSLAADQALCDKLANSGSDYAAHHLSRGSAVAELEGFVSDLIADGEKHSVEMAAGRR